MGWHKACLRPTINPRRIRIAAELRQGPMHRTIPPEHKDRLIRLEYILELPGELRLTNAGRQRIAEGE